MKKIYMKPSVVVVRITVQHVIAQSVGVYNNKSVDVSSAMGRQRYSSWDDEE